MSSVYNSGVESSTALRAGNEAWINEMNPLRLIEDHAEELRTLGARRIGIFGSFARGEAAPESDVDVYLEFATGMKSYDNFFAIHELLQGLFQRSIDLVTDTSLSQGKARLILPTVRYATLDV